MPKTATLVYGRQYGLPTPYFLVNFTSHLFSLVIFQYGIYLLAMRLDCITLWFLFGLLNNRVAMCFALHGPRMTISPRAFKSLSPGSRQGQFTLAPG